MDSIVFEGFEYDPETKIRKGPAPEQEELFDGVDGMTALQRMATGEALRTYSYEPEEQVI